jgi:iron(III) transport system substrate-binding protein
MNMRLLRILAAMSIAAMALAACAGDVQQAAEESTDEEPDTAAEADPGEDAEADPAEDPDDDAASEVSGELSFYTSQPDADYEALIAAFNEVHPDVEVSVFRSGTEEVISRLLAEEEAGGVQADVLLIADELNFRNLKERGLLASYESPELDGIPDEFVDEDFTFSGTKVIDTAIAINTNLVEEPPTSWNDLLGNPGQVTMASPQYSGAAAYNLGVITRDDRLGWDFYETLASEDATVLQGNGGVLEAVAEGRSEYGIVVSFIVARAAEQGSPVAVVYPEEGVLAITEPVGILEGAQNREAAEAFVDFVLSQEGQELAASLGYTPLRDGVEPPAGMPTAEELTLLEPEDLGELLENQEADVRRFVDLFGEA